MTREQTGKAWHCIRHPFKYAWTVEFVSMLFGVRPETVRSFIRAGYFLPVQMDVMNVGHEVDVRTLRQFMYRSDFKKIVDQHYDPTILMKVMKVRKVRKKRAVVPESYDEI